MVDVISAFYYYVENFLVSCGLYDFVFGYFGNTEHAIGSVSVQTLVIFSVSLIVTFVLIKFVVYVCIGFVRKVWEVFERA